MDDDLVLLTSYFNLANSRRQDTADTFRVDPALPSATSPSGAAALYVVTESSTGGNMGPRARRLAADTIAWEYSARGEDAPAPRLKAALRAAHEALHGEYDGHVSVGASVIAVEGTTVYLAQAAPAQVYVLHDGSLHSIPADVKDSLPFSRALGGNAGPQLFVFRDEIAAGDVLSLCSSWFHRSADPEDLRECFSQESADDIAASLYELAQQGNIRDACAIVIEAAHASELETLPEHRSEGFMEQVDGAVQTLTRVGRMVLAELRPTPTDRREAVPSDAATHTPIGARRSFEAATILDDQATSEIPSVPSLDEGARGRSWNPDDTATWDLSDLQVTEPPKTREHPTEETPVVLPECDPPDPAREPMSASYLPGLDNDGITYTNEMAENDQGDGVAAPLEETEKLHRSGARPARKYEASPELDTEAERHEPEPQEPRSEMEEVNARLHHDMDMSSVIPPVQAFPDPGTEPSRIYATSKDIQAVNRRPRRFGGVSRDADSGAHVLRPGSKDIDLRQPVRQSAPSAVVWLSAAVVLAFAVIAGALFLRSHRHTVAAVSYPHKARHNITLALAAKLPSAQNKYLLLAAQDIVQARSNGDSKADIQSLQARLFAASDTIYHVTRENSPVVVATFTQPTQLAMSPDAVYVLDTAKKQVFSVTPNTNSSPTVIVQAGEVDNNLTFDIPTQLATSGSTSLVLDEHNTLVRAIGTNKTATTLTPASSTEHVTAMANFGPDVYLLDAAGNQVWRYADAVSGYNSVPTPFFSPKNPDLGQPVSFTLDDRYMYILKTGGGVLKYDTQSAAIQPFRDPASVLRKPLKQADSIFTDVGLQYVWIADPGNARIVQLNKNGTYVRSYMAAAGAHMDLRQIKSIGVPPTGKTLFVLSGTTLYSFPVTP